MARTVQGRINKEISRSLDTETHIHNFARVTQKKYTNKLIGWVLTDAHSVVEIERRFTDYECEAHRKRRLELPRSCGKTNGKEHRLYMGDIENMREEWISQGAQNEGRYTKERVSTVAIYARRVCSHWL